MSSIYRMTNTRRKSEGHSHRGNMYPKQKKKNKTTQKTKQTNKQKIRKTEKKKKQNKNQDGKKKVNVTVFI